MNRRKIGNLSYRCVSWLRGFTKKGKKKRELCQEVKETITLQHSKGKHRKELETGIQRIMITVLGLRN